MHVIPAARRGMSLWFLDGKRRDLLDGESDARRDWN